jgi:hypothetical protein
MNFAEGSPTGALSPTMCNVTATRMLSFYDVF